jgi:hypothetical protein
VIVEAFSLDSLLFYGDPKAIDGKEKRIGPHLPSA